MKPEVFKGYLDLALTDTCNRYLNLVDGLGVIDGKKRTKKSKDILAARDALLDQWVPFYAKHLAALVDEAEAKEKKMDRSK